VHCFLFFKYDDQEMARRKKNDDNTKTKKNDDNTKTKKNDDNMAR